MRPVQLPVFALIRVVLTLAAFALAVVGFSQAYAPGEAVTLGALGRYGYPSLQLIVGQFPDALADKPLPWTLQVARFALPLTAAFATLSVAWTQVRNTLRLRLIRTRGEHLVLAGDESLAARVATRERAAKRPVLLWTDDKRGDWVEEAAEHGAPHISLKGPDKGAGQLGLAKARALLLAGPDDAANVSLAGAALEAALKVRAPGDPLTIIARVDDPDLRGPLERRFDGPDERSVARVRFASLPDIAARRLFLTAPLDAHQLAEAGARRLYVLGFGPTAERYVLRLLAGAHFRGGAKPAIVVLDPEAERRRAVFLARRPGAVELAPVHFVNAAADQPSLVGAALDAAIAEHGSPTSLVVDPADPARALAVALAVEEHFARRQAISPPIHAHLPGGTTADELGAAIVPFGDFDTLADPELLLQERLDDLARAIHDFYFEGRLEEGDVAGSRSSMHEWEALHEQVRDDNRLAADCYELKLRDVGARLLPVQGLAGAFAFTADELEELSRAEHDRWMAAKLLDGWRHGLARDDEVKLHPDIVPYDALTEARKDLDREQIRVITRLAATTGRRAARDLVVLVEPQGEAAPTLGPALAELRTAYPDRALVLLGAFENPGVRAAFEAADADAVRFTVAREPEATVRALERAKRGAARAMLRRADRVYALAARETAATQRMAFARGLAHLRLAAEPAEQASLPTMVIGRGGVVTATAAPVEAAA